jgi:hypothetical protein
MINDRLSRFRIFAVSLIVLILSAASAQAGGGPYVVHGNQHIIVGITLDEAAVRAALPEGFEPTKGITGGINLYNSKGGAGV